ncbi:MAG: hypothetical protein WKG00_22065 [Polyangiaceae bacterium]
MSTAPTPDRLDWKRLGLSAGARATVRATTEALLCDEDARGRLQPPRDGLVNDVVDEFDHSVGRGSIDLRRGYRVLAFVLEWLPIFVIRKPARMSRMSLDDRVAYLEGLESSRVGLLVMLYVAFKVPLCIPAFEEGEELALTGFDREHTTSRRRLPTVAAAARVEGEPVEASS